MITKDNFKDTLLSLGFEQSGDILFKKFENTDTFLKADLKKQELIYPEIQGLLVHERQTCNFKANENFVVFECVHRLLQKGYKPEHIELEPKWQLGHGASGGRADVLIKDNSGKALLIIECKTEGKEFNDAWKATLNRPTQLFTYAQQVQSTKFICLYASDFVDGKATYKNYIISLQDNNELLEKLKDKEPRAYRDAQEVEDLFKAWKYTYEQDAATRGIFEKGIPAYYIGEQQFTIADLNTISSKDIQGKYHEFATILRQHNVSGRENAFDKLVNLFLCKIVDETQNPDNLKFYWKGIAIDSYFDLQDRLQKLYQAGMSLFLNEEVTYIEDKKIDEAFRFFINDPDATRDTIKKYFRQLKFFTNNDFAFVDVHNEKLFYQNSAVLLEVVKMMQDIRLKTEEQNQFLGDMFEGFLDQGVKQSEGQFFTPMPIVKFILNALPLEQLIAENEQPPKVIDYACGAGHFLNEYAAQIKPYVEKHKAVDVSAYYPAVVGIEKEYRLSKVAKVSAFMYGQDDIKIIHADALAAHPGVKDGEFAALVANPPYSVKGFLETLPDTDRNAFELLDTIDEKSYNNSIETFFIERAKQLLQPGGVAGIVVPSSILSKGSSKTASKKQNVYVATREILLKYFDIVAIAEFGSGTFGKTGTNTVTLFIRRKQENPAPADHYQNRVEAWFKDDASKDGVFADEYLLKKYCQHTELNFADYKTLLHGTPSENLLSTDIFKSYRQDFDKLPEVRDLKKKKFYKAFTKEEQQAEINRRFTEYLHKIEQDKLYYFILASLNPQEVVIVKSPANNNAKKKFLGYEWSSAKGNEGIKYLGGKPVDIPAPGSDDEENNEPLDEDDKRVLSNIFNLNTIQTPLYDPSNPANPDKINHHIAANFRGGSITIPEHLQELVSTAKLTDMLDFSRREFNKAISLTPKKSISIETQWDLVKLGDVVDVKIGRTPPRSNSSYFTGDNLWVSISEMNGQVITNTKEKLTDDGVKNSNVKLTPKDTTLLSFKLSIGKTAIAEQDLYTNEAIAGLIPKGSIISNSYLFW